MVASQVFAFAVSVACDERRGRGSKREAGVPSEGELLVVVVDAFVIVFVMVVVVAVVLQRARVFSFTPPPPFLQVVRAVVAAAHDACPYIAVRWLWWRCDDGDSIDDNDDHCYHDVDNHFSRHKL